MAAASSAQGAGTLAMVKAQDKRRDDFIRDAKLSFEHEDGGVSNMLMSAPVAINYLGNLRFIAYKQAVLPIQLNLNSESKIKHASLTSAIEQLVQLSNKAFKSASLNMMKLESRGQSLFGGSSVMTEILGMLGDSEYAQKALAPAMTELRDGVAVCKDQAQDSVTAFGDLLAFTEELHLLVSDKVCESTHEPPDFGAALTAEASAGSQRYRVGKDQEEAAKSQQRNENKAAKLQKEVDMLVKREEAANRDVQKSLKNNEWKMFGLKLAGDTADGVFGIVSEAIKAPRLAAQVVESISRIRNPSGEALTRDPSTGKKQAAMRQQEETPDMDPALALAHNIQAQVLLFKSLIDDNIRQKLMDGEDSEMKRCLEGMGGILDDLERHKKTKPIVDAERVLNDSIRTGQEVLKSQQLAMQLGAPSQEWTRRLEKWQSTADKALNGAAKLMSLASFQPGQGFGNRSSATEISDNIKQSTLLLQHRQLRLEARQKALKKAQDDLAINVANCEKAMENSIRLADEVTRLEHNKDALKQLLGLLKAAVDVVSKFQGEMQRVLEYFETMTMVVDTVGLSITRKFLRTIESGTRTENGNQSLAYGESQARSIRGTVLQLRGFFSLYIDEARRYRKISTENIEPCLREVSQLPMSEISEQEEKAAKDRLHALTLKAKERIQDIARNESERMRVDLGGRIDETVKELDELRIEYRLPEVPEATQKAIQEGIEEAAEQSKARQEARMHLQETIGDM